MKSIVTDDLRHCIICNRIADATHHLLSGSYRQRADTDGLIVGLCNEDHNLYEDDHCKTKPLGYSCDMHHCRKLEILGKIIGQLAWEKNFYRNICIKNLKAFDSEHDTAREMFLRTYGKKYI